MEDPAHPRAAGPGSSMSDFRAVGTLGHGAHGTALKAISRLDGQAYCLKHVHFGQMSDRRRRKAVAEVLLLRRIVHPHVIRYYNCFVHGSSLVLVLELAEGGDLQAVVDAARHRGRACEEARAWRILWQLLHAVACLHGKGIVHRDIKPSNVFLDLDGSVKLGDLGVAAEAGGADVLRGRVGTPLYLSPEQARGGEHGLAADVWSAGCVLYCVCAGRPPFVGATVGRVCRSIVRSEVPPLPAQYSAALRSTVRSMLRKAPAARPTPAQLLESFPASVRATLPRAPTAATVPTSARGGRSGQREGPARVDARRADSRRTRRPPIAPVRVGSAPASRRLCERRGGAVPDRGHGVVKGTPVVTSLSPQEGSSSSRLPPAVDAPATQLHRARVSLNDLRRRGGGDGGSGGDRDGAPAWDSLESVDPPQDEPSLLAWAQRARARRLPPSAGRSGAGKHGADADQRPQQRSWRPSALQRGARPATGSDGGGGQGAAARRRPQSAQQLAGAGIRAAARRRDVAVGRDRGARGVRGDVPRQAWGRKVSPRRAAPRPFSSHGVDLDFTA